MIFGTLKEKCNFYRDLGEHNLLPNGHILMMLDGRSFSKLIKNKFKKPFDDKFVDMMNETAKYLCENISGVQFAYVQSDEISLYIKDEYISDSFFNLRSNKLLSIAASLATGKFNQLYIMNKLIGSTASQVIPTIKEHKPAQFDCKVWNVPNENEVFAWFLYRQIDCIRNSKQQAAQTWFSQKKLSGKNSDEQIELLKSEHNVDWNSFREDWKYGRLIKKVEEEFPIPEKYVRNGVTTTTRKTWKAFPMPVLTDEIEREALTSLISGEDLLLSSF
jgi:tRNA(His) 5'-end guanylyltransferase